MHHTTLYGLKPSICDTMKKAMAWLTENEIEFTLHDYRADGVSKELVQQWIVDFGWDQVINKRGTTWRSLDDEVKNTMDNEKALVHIMENPTMIKRPLLNHENNIIIGFSAKRYDDFFTK